MADAAVGGGQSWVQPMSRRQMLATGALAIPGVYVGGSAGPVFMRGDEQV